METVVEILLVILIVGFFTSCLILLGLPFGLLVGKSRMVKGTTFVVLAIVALICAFLAELREFFAVQIYVIVPMVVSLFFIPYTLIATFYSVSDAVKNETNWQRRFNVISCVNLIIIAVVRIIFKFVE